MILQPDELKEYSTFLKSHPRGHLLQSHEWARVKDNWKNEIIIVRRGGKIVGSISILIRKLPFFPLSLMYAPRGPVCDLSDASVLEELTKSACETAKKYRAMN